MGSAMRKMGVYLGLLEDTERYDDEYYDEYDERPQRGATEEAARPAPVANISERRRPQAAQPQAAPQATVAELSRITTLHPRTYNDAGLVFAVRGTIERVTNKVFLLSPPNVSVAAEDKQRIADAGGFFNQS